MQALQCLPCAGSDLVLPVVILLSRHDAGRNRDELIAVMSKPASPLVMQQCGGVACKQQTSSLRFRR
jgi:hypothetical protein